MKNVLLRWLLLAIVLLNANACAYQREVACTAYADSLQTQRIKAVDSTFVQRIRWVQAVGDTVFVRDTIAKERIVYRLRVDTVYAQTQVKAVSPPVKYVPRFYKVCACLVAALSLLGICRIVVRVCLARR